MSAALRTIQATPSMRPLGAAFAGIVVASAIIGLLAVGQLATAKPEAAPAPVAAQPAQDQGSSSGAAGTAPVLNDGGRVPASSGSSGGIRGSGRSSGAPLAQ